MKSHRRHPVFAPRLNRYLTTCLAVGVVAACSTSNQSPVTPTATTGQTVSDVYQVASYWQPTPQLDLLSPAGTFVRGAMESNSAIITTQSKAVAYPGFPEPDNLSYPSRFSADQQIRTSFNGGRIFTVLDVQEAFDPFGDWRIAALKTEVLKPPIPRSCNAKELESKAGQPSTPGWPSSGPPSAKPTS